MLSRSTTGWRNCRNNKIELEKAGIVRRSCSPWSSPHHMNLFPVFQLFSMLPVLLKSKLTSCPSHLEATCSPSHPKVTSCPFLNIFPFLSPLSKHIVVVVICHIIISYHTARDASNSSLTYKGYAITIPYR